MQEVNHIYINSSSRQTASFIKPRSHVVLAPYTSSYVIPYCCSRQNSRSTSNGFSYSSSPVIQVTDNDVLCGRGGATNLHPGNIKYRKIVKMHQGAYFKAKKKCKPKVSAIIVKSIHDNNGRFLKKDDATEFYFEITDTKAREKTSQALREGGTEFKVKTTKKTTKNTLPSLSDQCRDNHNKVSYKLTIGKWRQLSKPDELQVITTSDDAVFIKKGFDYRRRKLMRINYDSLSLVEKVQFLDFIPPCKEVTVKESG